MIELLEKGIPIVEGGLIEHPAWLISAASFIRSEEARIREEFAK
jgi:hypothetical protein